MEEGSTYTETLKVLEQDSPTKDQIRGHLQAEKT